MDNFSVPKQINRNVVKALSVLQTNLVHLIFFPMESIVRQVELQMQRNKSIKNLEDHVHRSLCSLTRLGVVARVGPSNYALRQALQFSGGVSAIPWKTIPKVHKARSSRKLIHNTDKKSVFKTKSSKLKVSVKPTIRKSKVKLAHPKRKLVCSACRSALETFTVAYPRLKIGNEKSNSNQNLCFLQLVM